MINHINTSKGIKICVMKKVQILQSEYICTLDILNWHKNRKVDPVKVQRMKKVIQEQNYVEGILYLAKYDNIYFCYDGIHRIRALHELSKDKSYTCVVDIMDYSEDNIQNRLEILHLKM